MSESRVKTGRRGAPKGCHPVSEWKPGQSGNPAGGLRKGQSYAELYRTINACTVDEVRELIKRMGGSAEIDAALARMPGNLTLKTLKTIRTSVANICEPTATLLQFEADREEGKVPDKVEVKGTLAQRVVLEGGAWTPTGKPPSSTPAAPQTPPHPPA